MTCVDLYFYSASSMKLEITDRHAIPHRTNQSNSLLNIF